MPTTPHVITVRMEYQSQGGICTAQDLLKGKYNDGNCGEEQAECLDGTKALTQDRDRENDGDHGVERCGYCDQGGVAVGVIRGEESKAADSRQHAVKYAVSDTSRALFEFPAA